MDFIICEQFYKDSTHVVGWINDIIFLCTVEYGVANLSALLQLEKLRAQALIFLVDTHNGHLPALY